ncbi:hypothetical protein [Catellatospora tritici]|uniref:hypothetical protein n=1 Tax=Catellatospora tritici TaxID=2851566 RepID=UPI001C2CF657|nr:hypothetical protein [Catellatospora tritici]MBV1853784.1 hypothetical protein [Catellatospora tritici]
MEDDFTREFTTKIVKVLALWAVLPILSVMFLVQGARHLGPSWRAHQEKGLSGVFASTACVMGDCTTGSWTADDGSLTLPRVGFVDPPVRRVQLGDRLPARYTGAADEVYGLHSDAYQRTIAAILLGVAGLGVFAVVAARRIRRRRAERLS